MSLLHFLPRADDFSRTKAALFKDFIAGVTVAIVALPLALGFGITSDVSAKAGLTTAIIAGFVAALFGGSRFQVSGPTGAMTVVLIPVVHKFGIIALPILGLMAAVLVIVMALLKFGPIINRVPWAVVEGFTVGIAVIIALQQLPLALGVVKGDGDKTLEVAYRTIAGALNHELALPTIAVVVLTLITKFGYPHFSRRIGIKIHIPASFVALLVSILSVKIFSLHTALIGDIPRSVGSWSAPVFANFSIMDLAIPALWIALLIAIESLLAARVADTLANVPSDQKFDSNRELFGQGLATAAASIFGGMPATGAIARTSVNVRSHAQSRMAAIFHAVVLLFIALIAAPLVESIPSAAIAGVLLGTSYRILNPASIRESFRTTKTESLTLVVTAISTIAIDLIWGIAIGIVLHLLLANGSERMRNRHRGK
jgi:sulfate permease, SulP family